MGETALIVEDHPDQARMVARMVNLKGYEAVVAETGEQALGLCQQHRPDVVLLDLMLPDISGFEVCRLLRSDRETVLTPIVMLTALHGADSRSRGFRVGANAYVTKPYGPSDLFEALAEARSWRDRLVRNSMRGEIHLELNSETTFLQEVNDFLASLFATTPLGSEQVSHLRQGIMEMGQNAIEWGNKYHTDKLVWITYRLYADRVEITIRDQGEGFDPAGLEHAASPDDPLAHMDIREKLGLREGGFGILISRGMVDELRYNERGNEVTLIKRFPAPAAS
jgi:CheY-like chemotaxis protein/anti-sigma regulatory factor (Ser/Thr protein kinase)